MAGEKVFGYELLFRDGVEDYFRETDAAASGNTLDYRLLRYLNSAAFGIEHEVHSIRHALTLLGERESGDGYAWSLP